MSQEKCKLMSDNKIIRLNELSETLGLNKKTIRMMSEQGTFPAPIKLGKRAIGWKLSDINKWLETRNEF